MASVASAAIIEGSLIIGLDDGSIINCGFVQGPQGLKGDPGPMGATGDPGADGNTIHTVGGTPRNDIGVDGDYAIDNINWRIYGPKSGGVWGKAKEMLPGKEVLEAGRTGTMATGGGGGGGTSGPSIERPPIFDDGTNTPPIIYPPLPGQPGSNLQPGDMWIDAEGALHFYYNNQWNKVRVYSDAVLPAEDAPYTIVTPNGEIFVNQKQYNEWLYTRTDRRPILSTTPPTIHPDFPAYPLRAGDYWIDDNNRLYFWDGGAWLPIEGNAGRAPIFAPTEPTEHPDYVAPNNQLEVGDVWYDTDANFKQYIWDGSLWVAVTPERKEAFTRFYEAVDPATYNSGNDGTCALAGAATIDAITNVKLSGNDNQGKVRYLYKVNEDILIEDERNGAYAVLRVTAVNVAGDYDVELEHYNGVSNIDFGQIYAFGSAADRGAIPDVGDNTHQPGTLDDRYVNEDGDIMTGSLLMDDASIAIDNGEITLTQSGTAAELDASFDKAHEDPRFSTIRSTPPVLIDPNGDRTIDFSKAFGLQIPLDTGNTFKNKFKVNNRNGDIVVVSGGTGPSVDFGNTFPGNQNGYEPGYEGGVQIKGIPTPAVDNTEPTLAVNKEYVDTRDQFLQQEIIELEEEIEALAPTTERGSWILNLAGTVANAGQFTMYDGAYGAPGVQPNGKIQDVESIWFNEIDTDGTPHGFAGVQEDDLLELFVDGSPEYGLWSVVGTPHYETAGTAQFWVIDVAFRRTLEDDTTFEPGDLCRLKIFKAPEGGSATEFVRKSGDEMSGDLTFLSNYNAYHHDSATASTRIEFKNTRDNGTVDRTYLYKIGTVNGLATGGQFRCKSFLAVGNYIFGWNASTGSSYNPRIYLADSGGGRLKWGDDEIAAWSGDGFYYYGDVTQEQHVSTKEYVDDKITELLAKIEELEMAGGTTESYQFQMYNKTAGSSTSIGPQINTNQIMSCNNDGDNWYGNNTHLLSSEYRHIYVCFEDGYQLNSTGQMSVVAYSNSNQYDVRNSNVATFNISGVEVCPPNKSSGKNIYRAVIQLDAYKASASDSSYASWGEGYLYLTFSGGSLTKTSA